MRFPKIALTASLTLCGMTVIDHAEAAVVTLADYPFTGNSTASVDAESQTLATSITYSTFVNSYSGNTFTPTVTSDYLRISTQATGGGNNVATSGDELSEAIANNAYFAFKLQLSGNSVSLDTLTFDHQLINANTAAATVVNVAVFAGTPGFTASVGGQLNAFQISYQGSVGNLDSLVYGRSIDLSIVPAMQDRTTDVEFRFYVYDNSHSTRYSRFDNIQLAGTVPEPAMIGTLAVATGFACIRRRRR